MIILSSILLAATIPSLVGLVATGIFFVLQSLAPKKQLGLLISLLIFEMDWIVLWFISLCFLGNGMTTWLSICLAAAGLAAGLVIPIAWLVYARIALRHKRISPIRIRIETVD